MLKVGFIGPAEGNVDAMLDATDFLLRDADASSVIYLGDDEMVEEYAAKYTKIVCGQSDFNFLDRAAKAAVSGSTDSIDKLLELDQSISKLGSVRAIPRSPARSVEMIADRIVIVVFDKGVLDEEDIVNSNLIVFGKSKEVTFKRFGSRYFFSPGPLSAGCVGLVEQEDENRVSIATFDLSGAPIWREVLSRGTKVSVSV